MKVYVIESRSCPSDVSIEGVIRTLTDPLWKRSEYDAPGEETYYLEDGNPYRSISAIAYEVQEEG